MRKRIAIVAIAAAVLSLSSACDRHHRTPVEPIAPIDSSAGTIEITGQTNLANPGDATQLTATLRAPDGTSRDVTAEASWSVTQDEVVRREGAGLFRAQRYGSTVVGVTFGDSISRWTTLRVSPPDTFLVSGSVRSDDGAILTGMRVEVETAAGTFVGETDTNGLYILPGRGAGMFRASGEGFEPAEVSLVVMSDMSRGVTLLTRSGKASLGIYQVTITASGSCSLPAAAMQRTFEAEVVEAGSRLYVVATSGDFVAWGNEVGFTGVRNGNAVEFELSSNFAEFPYCLVEEIPGLGELGFEGKARGSMSEGGISTMFDGRIHVLQHGGASCAAADHRLEMARLGAS